MRAVVLPEFGSALEIRDIAVPQPADGEVRVRVHAASVNGFDVAVAGGYLRGLMEHRFPVALHPEGVDAVIHLAGDAAALLGLAVVLEKVTAAAST